MYYTGCEVNALYIVQYCKSCTPAFQQTITEYSIDFLTV